MNFTNGSQHEQAPQAASIDFNADHMYVHLTDGRTIVVPVTAYKRLQEATPQQRLGFRIFGRGEGIRWDEIDEDLSVSGLLRDFGAKYGEHSPTEKSPV